MRTILILLMTCGIYSAETQLVNQLVTSNPKTSGEWTEELPKNWSVKEQERVDEVYCRIVATGKPIVPELIMNINRNEFSMPVSTSVPYSPFTVGDVCMMALSNIYDNVGVRYKSRRVGDRTLMGMSYFSSIGRDGLAQWWTKVKDKEVSVVQLDIKNWYVEREKQFGFTDKDEEERILNGIEGRFERK